MRAIMSTMSLNEIKGEMINAATSLYALTRRFDGFFPGVHNPTGKDVRNDRGGSGRYGAPRTKKINGQIRRYQHNGIDLSCDPGQEVLSPISGHIIRSVIAYNDTKEYTGLIISNELITVRLLYVALTGKENDFFEQRQVIGKAQDISKRYREQGVTPHVHVQIDSINPELFFLWGCLDGKQI